MKSRPAMPPKIRAHVNAMIGKFHKEIAKREPPGLLRIIAMYRCARLAHQRANEDAERAFWKRYLLLLEARADQYRTALLDARPKVDPKIDAFFKSYRKNSSR